MAQPIDVELNNAILHMVWRLLPDGFDVLDHGAPSTFAELVAHLDSGKRMAVWSGASDRTIFGDARVNHAFRAWHDYHHYRSMLGFTAFGEHEVCERQCRDLLETFGDSERVRYWCRVIRAEVNGQREYADWHGGEFPTDQMAFVHAYLRDQSVSCFLTF